MDKYFPLGDFGMRELAVLDGTPPPLDVPGLKTPELNASPPSFIPQPGTGGPS